MNNNDASLAHKMGVLSLVTLPFIGLIAGIIQGGDFVSLFLFGVFSALTILGVTIGFHRLATHKSFETYDAIKFFLLGFGSMTGQGRIHKDWGPMHLLHHVESDGPDDLHSPTAGFIHSHFWWLFRDEPEKYNQFEKEICKDKVTVFVGKYFIVWVVIGLILPVCIGLLLRGNTEHMLRDFLWGGLARMFFVNHVTWSVNSICHMFGGRDFATKDNSRNNIPVAILAGGEGWHNNHHAFPKSPKHGLLWWQFDLSYVVIKGLEFCHLAWDVDRFVPSPEVIEARRIHR